MSIDIDSYIKDAHECGTRKINSEARSAAAY
jgi:hypothetical protein